MRGKGGFLGWLLGKRGRRKPAKKRRSAPRWKFFEPLEDRKLLSVGTDVFAGLVDGNLSNSANYSSGSVPATGDNLVLTGYTQTNVNNDIAGLALSSLEFSTNYLNLGGNNLSIAGDLISDQFVTTAIVSANIVGGSLVKSGDGTVTLLGNDSNSGTYVIGGTLVAGSPGAIPNGGNLFLGNFSAFAAPTTNLVLNTFSISSQGEISVQYTINGADAPPFTIGIYDSPDGTTPSNLLQTFDVSDPLDLVGDGTAHTATVDADLGSLDPGDDHLLAELDAYNVPQSTTAGNIAALSVPVSAPLAGTFQQDDGSVYVVTGSDPAAKNVTISEGTTAGTETVTVNGDSETFQNVSAMTVCLDGGNDSLNAAGVSVPMTIYGGSGSDDITDGDGDDTIYGGAAGGNTINAGAGEDTIYGEGGAGSPGNTITGGAGDDTIYAGAGPDTITGGAGDDTITAGAGDDTITGGTGNNQIYGGSGTGTLDGSDGTNNWIVAGPGNYTIDGGDGNDWITCGAGNDTVYGGYYGNEVITGGSGASTIFGGSGVNEMYAGPGNTWMGGNGAHDVFQGGPGDYDISPGTGFPGVGLSNIEVENAYDTPADDGPGLADYLVQADPGHNTPINDWYFSNLNSGSRLGERTTTPIAVYANWQSYDVTLPAGQQWSAQATYSVYEEPSHGGSSTLLGSVTINQAASPGDDSPEPNDQPWQLLGVWNVPAQDTLDVRLSSANSGAPNSGDKLCQGDVMIHPIWPTVTARADEDGTGTFTSYDDYLNATDPAPIPVEGSGSRMEVDLNAAVDTVYAQIAGASMSDWTALLPAVSGLEFWTAASGGTQLTPDGNGDVVDDTFPSSGQYDRKVWVSIDPSAASTFNTADIDFTVDPDGAQVTCAVAAAATSSWTRSDWTGSPATSTYTGTATAHGDDATLRQLAADITGSASDYWLLKQANPAITIDKKTMAVPAGTEINIAPLLQKLEKTLRLNVTKAANAHKFAHFPAVTESFSEGEDMDEAEVNDVFRSGNGSFDCLGMANVVMASGLISTLNSGEFDAIFGTTIDIPYVSSTVSLDDTKRGDWLYFANDPSYLVGTPPKPKGDFQGENAIESVHGASGDTSLFWGWGGDPPTENYAKWCATLVNACNTEPPIPATPITTVSGYTGSAKFFDVAVVAQDIFDHRK